MSNVSIEQIHASVAEFSKLLDQVLPEQPVNIYSHGDSLGFLVRASQQRLREVIDRLPREFNGIPVLVALAVEEVFNRSNDSDEEMLRGFLQG